MEAQRVRPTHAFVEFRKEEIEQSIPARFEQMVAKYPERRAIKTPHHHLTYRELNSAANRIGRAVLDHLGEGEEPVAVLIANHASMIAAILGVMKAGKICVPLDSRFPRARTEYILRQSESKLLITNKGEPISAEKGIQNSCPVAFVEQLESEISTENLNRPIPPDGLAYILYTSGSTGQPKGVVQGHRTRLHDVSIYTNGLGISSDDRLALFYSCSSGQGMILILNALLNGAALLPYDLREEGISPLGRWLHQEEISMYFSIPSVFRQFAESLTGREAFPKLRFVHVGTDRVTKQDIDLYKARFPAHCVFVTGLASNETGRSRRFLIDNNTPFDEGMVPVGYPVDGKAILLLDDAGQEVGPNQVGEIVVKSNYIAAGYWKRPDLTNAAFRLGPDGDDSRMYFTGDLGVMRPDGCLFLMGRKDFQAKIRGYRIEVAEVEATLLNSGLVRDAAAVVREDERGNKRLVVYTIPRDEKLCSIGALRRSIQDKLPEYMVPTRFIMLRSFPLTPTGKIDRRSLPAPGSGRPQLDTPFVASRSPIEEELARIWSEVLGLDEVGIHDPFLELGGDSLTAGRVISRVINTFQVELSMQTLLEIPTVAEMANAILNHIVTQIGPDEVEHLLDELGSSPEND